MTAPIFVSHSSEDQDIVGELCDKLRLLGVDVWISFRDLKPGLEWDREIQVALEEASHIIVAVSKASILSTYVRAEVEYALHANKIVIPVIIEADVKVPIRWYTLQNVNWKDKSEAELLRLVAQLPKAYLMRFEEYLKDSNQAVLLKELLIANPQWIHPNARTTVDKAIMGNADFFHANSNTSGSYKYYYYLCSPYQPPFDSSGKLSAELLSKLEDATVDIKPGRFTMQLGFGFVEVNIFAGQRSHYSDMMYQERDTIQQTYLQKWVEMWPGRIKFSLDIASYTRILDRQKELTEQK